MTTTAINLLDPWVLRSNKNLIAQSDEFYSKIVEYCQKNNIVKINSESKHVLSFRINDYSLTITRSILDKYNSGTYTIRYHTTCKDENGRDVAIPNKRLSHINYNNRGLITFTDTHFEYGLHLADNILHIYFSEIKNHLGI